MIRLVVTALCVAGMAGAPPELATALAAPSVVAVQTSWQGWVRDDRTGEVFGGAKGYHVTAECGGAVVGGAGLVATAGHCVDDGKEGLLDRAVAELTTLGRVRDPALARRQLAEHAVVEGPRTGSQVVRRVTVTRGGDSVAATVAGAVAEDDLALLQVPWRGLPALAVAPGGVPVGAGVLAAGRPPEEFRQVRVVRRAAPFFEVTAPTVSGGPVVDTRGRLVGVASRGVSVSAGLADLLRGRHAGLGAVDRDYRTGLEAYFAGDYDRAVEYLNAVLGAAPGNEQARRYRDRAAARGGSAPGSGLSIALVVACGVLAAGSGVAGVVIAARRRRADMDTPPYGFPVEPYP